MPVHVRLRVPVPLRDGLEREEVPAGRHADVQDEVVGGAGAWRSGRAGGGGQYEGGDGGAHGGVGHADGLRVGVDVDGGEVFGGGEGGREGLGD